MSYANGRIPKSELHEIPGGLLARDAAITWNAMRTEYIADGGAGRVFEPGGPDSSYRSYERQVVFKKLWTQKGHPEKAADPGTSNHGLGKAVDIPSLAAQSWIRKNGHRFGWSHAEGARVGEGWHFTYVGAPKALLLRLRRDPLAGYTPNEKKWIREYDRLKKRDPKSARLNYLRRAMRHQAVLIKQAAEKTGWTRSRRRRLKSLNARK